jgi:hypothetical protein
MRVSIHGFDWRVYNEHIMPAFARWLIEDDDRALYKLYTHTRQFHEDAHLPDAMRASRTWPRGQAFVHTLPRGPLARQEYQLLCTPAQFTPFSDTYIYHHPPQISPQSSALRSIWGALVETYCQSSLQPLTLHQSENTTPLSFADELITEPPSPLHALFEEAGLRELAEAIAQSATTTLPVDEACTTEDADLTEEALSITLGPHPASLHMRGWLARHSLRAMVLFELLACGRRVLPFGTQAEEPFENYSGYLTPSEVHQLAAALASLSAPDPSFIEDDHAYFRQQQDKPTAPIQFVDELLPRQADAFLQLIQSCANYGLGLLCTFD